MARQHKLNLGQRLALLGALVFALLPLFWLLSSSFKPLLEFFLHPVQWLPVWPTLENYRNVFYPYINPAGFPQSSSWRAILTSGIIATSATCLSVSVSLMAACAISRHRAGGQRSLMFSLSFRTAPPIVIAIPIAAVIISVGLNDPYSGLILVYGAYTAPIATLMLKSFIDQVPTELEEAAMIDGANSWRIFCDVTLPSILPVLAVGIVLKTIFSLKMFDQVYMLTNGGPGNATQTLAHYIYFNGFKYYNMGYASAVSYLLVIPMFGLTWLYMKLVFLKR